MSEDTRERMLKKIQEAFPGHTITTVPLGEDIVREVISFDGKVLRVRWAPDVVNDESMLSLRAIHGDIAEDEIVKAVISLIKTETGHE